MRPDPEMIPVLIDTARALKGNQKRLFMARTVEAMGRGGQRWAEDEGLGRGGGRELAMPLDDGHFATDLFGHRSE